MNINGVSIRFFVGVCAKSHSRKLYPLIIQMWIKKIWFVIKNITKWYIYKPEFVLENKSQNSLELWGTNRSPNTEDQTSNRLTKREKFVKY